MSVRPVLRRVAAVVAGATITLAAGPLAGTALAAPVATTLSPASGATVRPPATVSVCYAAAVGATSSITVTNGDSAPVLGTSAVGHCGEGTNNKLVWTPDSALGSDSYSATAVAVDAAVPVPPTQTQWSFTVDATAPAAPNTLTVTTPAKAAVTVAGKTDPNTAVSVSVANTPTAGSTATGSGTSNGTGDFSIAGIDISGLADGAFRATVTATDAVGNASSATVDGVKDTVAPARTTTVPGDGGTAQTRDTVVVTFDEALSGTSTLVVKNGPGNTLAGGTAFSNDAKTMTFTAASPMTPAGGTYSVTANATDLAGNSAPSVSTFTIDMTPPGAPTVSLTDPVNIANADEAMVWGSAEPGATVNVSVDDSVAGAPATGSGTADSEGAYSVTVDVESLLDGAVTATATATDPAGNTGPAGSSTASTKDTQAPAAPSVELADPVTNASQATAAISGVAEPGATVSISVDDSAAGSPVTKDVTANADDGEYTTTLDLTNLLDGTVTASVLAIDAAGNPSTPGTDSATKDTGVPAAPSLTVPTVNDANKAAVNVTGTAEPGSTVSLTLSDGTDTVSTTTTAAGDGAYAKAMDASTLADGLLSATATAKDASGNESAATTVNGIAKDTGAPNAPTVVAPAYVNDATKAEVELSGTAEPASTVTITVSDTDAGTADVVSGVVADPTGNWTKTLSLASLTDGTLTVSATATDAAGNVSAAGTDTAEKDVAAPAAPAVSLTGPVNQSNVATAAVSGTAEAGSLVNVSVDDTDAATDPVTGSGTATGGSYSVPVDLSSLSDGALTAKATATDAAGNVSPEGTSASSAKDTTALDVASSSPAHNSTVQPPATISMTFNEPVDTSQSTISVQDSTNTALAGATSFTDGGRTIVFTPADVLADGGSPYTVIVSARDTDGTDSLVAGVVFTVDGTVPVKPTLDATPLYVNIANAAAVSIAGDAESGSTVAFTVDDATVGSPVTVSTTAADGRYALTADLTSLADGPLSAAVTSTDGAGNTSTTTFTMTKDTVAPATPSLSMPEYVNDAGKAAVALTSVAEKDAVVTFSVDDATPGSPVTENDLSGTGAADSETAEYAVTLDLTSLADGALSATAIATDQAGNPSEAGTDTATKDTLVPSAPVLTLSDPVNAANKTAVTVSGTAEPGSTVDVTVDDANEATAARTKQALADATTGAYSAELDVTSLDDGTLTASATATDAAGNVSTAGTDTATKDSSIPDVPTIDTPGLVTRLNVTAAPLSGTAEPGATVTVSIDDAGNDATDAVTGTATAGQDGVWSRTFDVSSLSDGWLVIDVTATDAAGNVSGTASDQMDKDVTRAFTIAVSEEPVSGLALQFTVTAHQTYDPGSGTDTTFTGIPVLTSSDGHFTAGTCSAAVAGVATCSGVVFGDLGAHTVTAAHGSGDDLVTRTKDVHVMTPALEYVTAPPATATPGQAFTFSFRPTVGVEGASTAGYASPRRLITTGGSTPGTNTLLTCAAALCEVTVTFNDRGPKTLSVRDTLADQSTPTAEIAIPYVTTMTLTRSALTVNAGSTVTLSGKLTNTTTLQGLAGRTLTIYRKTAPNTTLRPYTTVTTRSNGTWAKTMTVSRNTTYQVHYAGDATHLAAKTGQRRVNAAQVISVSWTPGARSLAASGRVSPNAAGRTVYLQYLKSDGTWGYARAKATVTSTSRYSLSRALAPGRYVFRTAIAATSVNTGGYSTRFTYTVR